MPLRRNHRDILIAVTGKTGAGKTTFISKATGRQDLEIGHSPSSCTQAVIPVTFEYGGRKITLIDTPGFDDTRRSDVDNFELLAGYLARTYGDGRLLDGLILLHPLTDNRLTRSESTRTRLFEEILGRAAFERVAIATTMWGDLPNRFVGESRAQGRIDIVWKSMLERGATYHRHDNNKESALRIIQALVRFRTPIILQLQTELNRNGGRIMSTSAAKELYDQLEEQIMVLRDRLANMQQEVDTLEQRREELQSDIGKLEEQKNKLRKLTIMVWERGVPFVAATVSIATNVALAGACAIM